jgi:hypothetical protein
MPASSRHCAQKVFDSNLGAVNLRPLSRLYFGASAS